MNAVRGTTEMRTIGGKLYTVWVDENGRKFIKICFDIRIYLD